MGELRERLRGAFQFHSQNGVLPPEAGPVVLTDPVERSLGRRVETIKP
jgi:hypothetical protein